MYKKSKNHFRKILRLIIVNYKNIYYRLVGKRNRQVTVDKDFVLPGISAYLSIYNDWSMLDKVLQNIKPFVNELIVVDGAYKWQAKHLSGLGKDPLTSSKDLYQILDDSGLSYKVIKDTWSNEVEKRLAGYEACTSRYIMRIDADEILNLEYDDLVEFVASESKVAEFYMPTYLDPQHLIANMGFKAFLRPIPTQKFLFDSNYISSRDHLSYLWLVLGDDNVPEVPLNKFYPVHSRPIGYCFHLTNWRQLENNLTRATFYILKSLKEKGAPKLGYKDPFSDLDFQSFLDELTPDIIMRSLEWSSFCVGGTHLTPSEKIIFNRFSDHKSQDTIDLIHQEFLYGRRNKLIEASKVPQVALINTPFYIDFDNIDGATEKLDLIFSTEYPDLSIEIIEMNNSHPFRKTFPLSISKENNKYSVIIPARKEFNILRYLSVTVHGNPSVSKHLTWKIG
jgi:hypothetical protein